MNRYAHIAVMLSALLLGACASFPHPGSDADTAAVTGGSSFDAAQHRALAGILNRLHAQATPAQYKAIVEAIYASPALTAQLDELARAGQLTRISVVEPVRGEPPAFGARRMNGVWTLTPEFIEKQATRRLFDLAYPDDILPNNMVFALGHLAFHAWHASALQAASAPYLQGAVPGARTDPARPAWMAAGNGIGTGTAEARQKWLALHMRDEAGAFIQGWNDVLDAAVHENRDTPLSPRQEGSLLFNLRYRAAFLKAVHSSDHHLVMGPQGIVADEHNLDAMADALHTSQVIDVE